MASGRKPVWLDEEAHLLIKEYAKLTKTSMTEITSQLVLEHVETLEGGTGTGATSAAPAGASAASAPAAAAPKAAAPKAAPKAASAPKSDVKPAQEAPKAKAEKPAPAPKRTRRANTDGVRYLGGIWLV